MGAQLNMKSDDACQLASRLAEMTGESLTTVVTRALRSELDREHRQRDRVALKARLLATATETSANMPEDVTFDHAWLYDDATGLPR